MGVFQSARMFPIVMADLAAVADDVQRHFQVQDFEVSKQHGLGGSWQISVHRGGLFKAVLGMKTALKIEIEPVTGGTQAKAGVGIMGSQAVPTAISMLLFWPVLVTQIWGMIQQSHLDDQAMKVIEASLQAHAGLAAATAGVASLPLDGKSAAPRTCANCGQPLPGPARFCPACGAKTA